MGCDAVKGCVLRWDPFGFGGLRRITTMKTGTKINDNNIIIWGGSETASSGGVAPSAKRDSSTRSKF